MEWTAFETSPPDGFSRWEAFQKESLMRSLHRFDWSFRRTARWLGISRSSVQRNAHKWGLKSPHGRKCPNPNYVKRGQLCMVGCMETIGLTQFNGCPLRIVPSKAHKAQKLRSKRLDFWKRFSDIETREIQKLARTAYVSSMRDLHTAGNFGDRAAEVNLAWHYLKKQFRLRIK